MRVPRAPRCRLGLAGGLCGLLLGCGDPLADGGFLGDATIRVHGVVQGPLPNPAHAAVAALWLGYGALAERALVGIEDTVLPITRLDFPPGFTCDLLAPPPGAGAYAMPDGLILPAFVRLGLLVVFDDVDGDGRLVIDAEGRPLGSDRILAQSRSHALLFVAQAPRDPLALDGQNAILSDWEAAGAHYNLIAIDAPPLSGHVVAPATPVVFTPAGASVSF
jgi:hypothetical protein